MAEQQKLRDNIEINKDLKLLTRSYQEHAIGQINFARYSVLYSRGFSKDLEEVFGNVRSSYLSALRKKSIKNMIKKNGRDIWILITANNKLYGDIVLKTSQFFAGHLKLINPDKVDVVIVGRQGKNYIDEAKLNIPYEYYEVPDTKVTVDFLKQISGKLLYYENVVVFYGRYDNLVTQTPVQVSLSGEFNEEELKDPILQKKQSFLFEPSIQEILSFFENQILSLLLNQTVQEAQLARFASRINAMEQAQKNIKKQLDSLKRQEKMYKISEMNKKQIELLAGRSLWNRS